MPTTTIKIDSAARDRLARVARARGISMAALLQAVSIDLQTEQQWTEVRSAYERLQREDPQGWVEYLNELGKWDATSSDPGDAAAEWPEYNQ
ncbi:MAG: hypothetical protein ACRDZO_20360 [Egibacteraceae bacterium]